MSEVTRNEIRERMRLDFRRYLSFEESVCYICFSLTNKDKTRLNIIGEVWNTGRYSVVDNTLYAAINYLVTTEELIFRYPDPGRRNDYSNPNWHYSPYDRGDALFLEYGTLWYKREYEGTFRKSTLPLN